MPSLAHRCALRASRALFRPVGALAWGLRSSGGENVPASGGAILCANHVSLLDPIVLQAVVRRPVCYLMTSEFYYWRPIRWASRLFEAIPVEPSGGGLASLLRAGRLLEQGDLLGIFPEGRVSRGAGLQAFRPGAALLALRHGVPLVPVWIHGTQEALPRDARLPRPSRISVAIGDAIPVPRIGNDSVGNGDVAVLTDRLRAAVASLEPPAAGGGGGASAAG